MQHGYKKEKKKIHGMDKIIPKRMILRGERRKVRLSYEKEYGINIRSGNRNTADSLRQNRHRTGSRYGAGCGRNRV